MKVRSDLLNQSETVFPTIANVVCARTGMMSAMCQRTSVSPFTRSQIFQCRVTLQSASQVSQETDAPADADSPHWHFSHLPRLTDQDRLSNQACDTSRLLCVFNQPLQSKQKKTKCNFFFPCLSTFSGLLSDCCSPSLPQGCYRSPELQPAASLDDHNRLQLVADPNVASDHEQLPFVVKSDPLRQRDRWNHKLSPVEIMLMFHSAASFFFQMNKRVNGGNGESLISQKEPEKRRVVGSQEAFLTLTHKHSMGSH